MLLSDEKYAIFNKVNIKGTHSLSELFNSYQGIITGCDKAFVIKKDDISRYGIEEDLLRPWIKNSHVGKFNIKPFSDYLIYSDLILSKDEYPNAVKFIEVYKERLMERRECKKGIRQWYQLQWGRKRENFEKSKLVYPYKSATNRFAVDNQGYYCSADVYSLALKEQYDSFVSLEYMAVLLNSKLFEFYFKCFAKKLSDKLFDYYPNTILRLKVNLSNIDDVLMDYSKKIFSTVSSDEAFEMARAVDQIIYKQYGLSDRQIQLIQDDSKEDENC